MGEELPDGFQSESARRVSDARRARRAALMQGYAEEAAAVVARLRQQDVDINDLWDLVNGPNEAYSERLAALIAELESARHAKVREALVRGLAIPEARGVADRPLLQELRRATAAGDGEAYGWVVANALGLVATPALRDELEEVALDDAYGMAREQIVETLARMPASPRTAAVIERALANHRLAPFALKVIERHAMPGFEDEVARLERDERDWVAKRAGAARLACR